MGIIGFILVLLVVNGLVSFALTKFIRSTGLAIVASAIITIMLFLLWGMNSAANARGEDVHDIFLAINIMIMFVVPGVIGTSAGFVLLNKRSKKNGDPLPDRRS
jgi:heme/copper-type cytochrome/quinol oxidase subunit 2